MSRDERIAKVKMLMQDFFSGKITGKECQMAIAELYTPEPELPLGCGTIMPQIGDADRLKAGR